MLNRLLIVFNAIALTIIALIVSVLHNQANVTPLSDPASDHSYQLLPMQLVEDRPVNFRVHIITDAEEYGQVSGAAIVTKAANSDSGYGGLTREQFMLAATLWGEARGEGVIGMRAVGQVVLNRVAQRFRGDSIERVVLWRKQFSTWNSNDPNRAKLNPSYLERTHGTEREAWENAKALAVELTQVTNSDYTQGAVYYHATSIQPAWASAMRFTRTIGRHAFYRAS